MLTWIAAALLAAVPAVPAFRNVHARSLSTDVNSNTFSLLDIARGSRRAARAPPERALVLPGVACVGYRLPTRVDGRPECFGSFALAAAAVGLCIARRVRHAWILVPLIAGPAGWTWLRLREDVRGFLGWMPGAWESARLRDWIPPWPWLLAGTAMAMLAAATVRARRAARESEAFEGAKEVFA